MRQMGITCLLEKILLLKLSMPDTYMRTDILASQNSKMLGIELNKL